MKLAVPREIRPGERRAAATPETVARLIKLGFEVSVETGLGPGASFSDDDYQAAGARLVADTRALWARGGHRAEGAAARTARRAAGCTRSI